jgi:hypothetical protein
MILILAIVIGLSATLIRAWLKNRTLKLPKFYLEWLVFLSVIPQVFAFYFPAIGRWIPESVIPYLQISTMLGLLIFTAMNLPHPGFWYLGLGLLSNFLVISFNGGWMPILPETLHRMVPSKPMEAWEVGTRLGLTKDRILTLDDTQLALFSDRFTVPDWISYKVAFSLGDVLISIGIVVLLWSLSQEQ